MPTSNLDPNRSPYGAPPRDGVDRADSPWVEGALRIMRGALAEVERHAVAGYLAGEECCGYLAGPAADGPLCDRAVALENMARVLHELDPRTYFQTPRTFFAFKERTMDVAVQKGASSGCPVKVLYHSHLDAGAYLSGIDQAVLSRGAPPRLDTGPVVLGPGPAWPIAFLVTSVRGGTSEPRCDDHKLFVWRNGAFAPSTFDIV